MTKNIFMYIKKVFFPVTIICLIAVVIFRWQGQSQAHTLVQEPQRGMTAMIEKLKNNGMQFPTYELTYGQVPLRNIILQDDLNKGEVFNLNNSTVSMMAAGLNQTLTLRIPDPLSKDRSVELELTLVDILAEGFHVKTASSNGQPVEVQSGKHYRGSVKGVTGSIAAISVFNNEVSGMFSIPEEGNFVLGKLGGDNPGNLHILYQSSDLQNDRAFKCETKDKKVDVEKFKVENKSNVKAEDAERSLNIFVEVDNDVYTARGSVASTVNWVQTLFNQSATLFANEGISVKLSDMFVWDSKSPYTATNLNGILDQFKEQRNSFNDHLGQLISMRVGGGIASVDTISNSNIANHKSYSHVQKDVKNIPANSLSVENFTHQLGHLIRLRHKDNEITDDETNIDLDFASQPAPSIQNKINSAVSITSSSACQALASPANETFTKFGGNGHFWVNAPDDCQWRVFTNAYWIKITSADNGFGVRAINYIVEANTSGVSRNTRIYINSVGGYQSSFFVYQKRTAR